LALDNKEQRISLQRWWDYLLYASLELSTPGEFLTAALGRLWAVGL